MSHKVSLSQLAPGFRTCDAPKKIDVMVENYFNVIHVSLLIKKNYITSITARTKLEF